MLFVVRHGQTDANVNHLFNGINDGDLTEHGVEQAKEAADQLERTHIDRIIASPLRRTLHTAEILNLAGLPIHTDERLIDRDYSELTLKPSSSITPEEKELLFDKDYGEVKGIESYQSLYSRVEDFLADLRARHYEEDILIVTHGDISFAIQEILTGNTEGYPQTATVHEFSL